MLNQATKKNYTRISDQALAFMLNTALHLAHTA
jgi:hypothetical protein